MSDTSPLAPAEPAFAECSISEPVDKLPHPDCSVILPPVASPSTDPPSIITDPPFALPLDPTVNDILPACDDAVLPVDIIRDPVF
jgi:hypothetical protein